ncbi:MAG TPA: tetratricopeptide repeat protein [Myxococcota bacterium]|nr:tetratricopeptide repeat protein [Myxococcota bacterium]
MSTNRDQLDNTTRSILHNSRGIDLAERGWLDEAIKEFKSAIQNAPDFAQGYDNLGTAYADKGDLFNALESYTKALTLESENPIALHNLGCFLSNHGNELAMRCFKEAVKIDPELYEARFNLGLCLAAEDKHEKAINQFELALLENEHDHDARFHLALSLGAVGKHSNAIKELLKVVKTDQKHESAWFNLGQNYQEQGFLEEAANAFTKAISLNNNNIDAYLSLASLLHRLERSKEAKSLIRRAMMLDPKKTEEFVLTDDQLCHDVRLIKQ